MRKLMLILFLFTGVIMNSQEYNKLNEIEKYVIEEKGTERPFSGIYTDHFDSGVYKCKKCNTPLFESDSKFHSGCGWPSFDDAIEGRVKQVPDKDGVRTEIVCSNCGGHLGHVFKGEKYTPKNTRFCVNSVSLDFYPDEVKPETAIFAGGCFWGVEYYFMKQNGVISTDVGYTGGTLENPEYYDVTTGATGHAEAVKVVYDPSKVSYETLTRLFFEIHDPTQENRQGPDIGTQYRSEVFYSDQKQKETAQRLINILKAKGYDVKTKLTEADEFYKAENYHQDYYKRKGSKPYCHFRNKRF